MPHVTPDTITDWPLWWFASLDSALERRDKCAAAEAIRQLERLGIEVRFLVPPGLAPRRGGSALWSQRHRSLAHERRHSE